MSLRGRAECQAVAPVVRSGVVVGHAVGEPQFRRFDPLETSISGWPRLVSSAAAMASAWSGRTSLATPRLSRAADARSSGSARHRNDGAPSRSSSGTASDRTAVPDRRIRQGKEDGRDCVANLIELGAERHNRLSTVVTPAAPAYRRTA
jgi:hypothetical protein